MKDTINLCTECCNEEFITIPEFPRYEISKRGNVRNARTKIKITPYCKTYELNNKCLVVRLYDDNNVRHTMQLVYLVLSTYHPEIKIKNIFNVKYKDGNYRNCNLSNLVVYRSNIDVVSSVSATTQTYILYVNRDSGKLYTEEECETWKNSLKQKYEDNKLMMLNWYENNFYNVYDAEYVIQTWKSYCKDLAEDTFNNTFIRNVIALDSNIIKVLRDT